MNESTLPNDDEQYAGEQRACPGAAVPAVPQLVHREPATASSAVVTIRQGVASTIQSSGADGTAVARITQVIPMFGAQGIRINTAERH